MTLPPGKLSSGTAVCSCPRNLPSPLVSVACTIPKPLDKRASSLLCPRVLPSRLSGQQLDLLFPTICPIIPPQCRSSCRFPCPVCPELQTQSPERGAFLTGLLTSHALAPDSRPWPPGPALRVHGQENADPRSSPLEARVKGRELAAARGPWTFTTLLLFGKRVVSKGDGSDLTDWSRSHPMTYQRRSIPRQGRCRRSRAGASSHSARSIAPQIQKSPSHPETEGTPRQGARGASPASPRPALRTQTARCCYTRESRHLDSAPRTPEVWERPGGPGWRGPRPTRGRVSLPRAARQVPT